MASMGNAVLLTIIIILGGSWWWSNKKTKQLKKIVQQKNEKLQQFYRELEQTVALHSVELQEVKIALEQAKQAKQNFLAKISSELKNPLHTILGYTQLLQRYPHLIQDNQENLEQIRQNGELLLALINDVLEIIQLETNQLELHETSFNIRRFLNSLEKTIQPFAIAKGINLVFFIPPDIPTSITTDEQKLRQALLNILDNALKYTEIGSVTLRVGISDRAWMLGKDDDPDNLGSHALFFEIEDTGAGIAPEQLKRIFGPLSANNKPEIQGIGLGLALSQKLIKLLGGKITLTSKIAQGTIVKVKIMVKGWEVGQWDTFLQESGRVIGLAPNQSEYRLLVVDDRRENRYLLIKLLEPLGFKLEEAPNGQEAIHLWSSWQPHLIFMDTRMPVMNGYEAIAQIQHLQASQSPESTKTIIIGLSSGTVEENQADILAAGCDDILQKPFDIEIILEKIAQHLKIRYFYEIEEKGDFDEDDISTIPLSEFPSLSYSSQGSGIQRKDRKYTKNFLSSNLNSEQLIQSNNLDVMPRDWIEELFISANAGDGQKIEQLLKEIPPEYETLANNLQSLVNQFNFRQLKELTQFLLSRP
ncbi:ATP-binding protein [Chroococcus sp. FPU101]|uniref:ATP-binding response regulator n=1 Tax=Chroococcus sp. FPU101 TaxID=1974212 RepID=UPI001A8ED010|nr:ATP-binding protein [Chroococcus sp. FPU101]GFE68121.1 hypothetical protein CFPU101_07310 [Chroococcus sp. FPU101]